VVEQPVLGAIQVGDTPLIRDRALTDGTACWVKWEALEPSGHVTDRIAAAVVARLEAPMAPRTLVSDRLDALTLSFAHLALPRGFTLTVFADVQSREDKRWRTILHHYGVKVKRIRSGQSATELAQAFIDERKGVAAWMPRQASPAVGAALVDELRTQLNDEPLSHVVLPVEARLLVEGVLSAVDANTRVHVVDAPTPEHLAELQPVAKSMGRQGLLISPSGAAVVAKARQLRATATTQGHVIAVIPDGGHRHLGWVPGWLR